MSYERMDLGYCTTCITQGCLCKSFQAGEVLFSVSSWSYSISKLCHPNLPWFYRIVWAQYNERKMIVMSIHSIVGKSCRLYDALNPDTKSTDLALIDWRKIMLGLAAALCYIQNHEILHNDINIVLDGSHSWIRCILVDFGKSCFVSQGKKYRLSESSKQYYKKHHPQIAPDVRNGHCHQSTQCDVYSVSRVLQQINEKMLSMPV